jgi:hypothetical protein
MLPWSSDSAMVQRTITGALVTEFRERPWQGVTGDVFLRAAAIDAALAKADQAAAADAMAKAAERVNQLARR